MRVNGWSKQFSDRWVSLSIRRKIEVFTGVVFLVISLSIIFDIWVVNFSMNDFKVILDDNAKCSDLVDTIEEEERWFEAYIKHPSEENHFEMEQAILKTKQAINALPDDYSSMNIQRYAKTWSIKNSYENYTQKRDAVLGMSEENLAYIKELYKVYDMQVYLHEYARRLMRYTLQDGKTAYLKKVRGLRRLPMVVIISGFFLFSIMLSLSNVMNKALVVPIMKLVNVSKEIAANNFFIEDVRVDNQDEIGELVNAFNKMKFATGQYITTMEERRNMIDLLHQEELEKMEAEKNLETANLELLKSQINPHFLFNTLNVIAGMANLEDADTTEKMIKALSSIFRYNLKTPQSEVFLSQELYVVKNYLYLQQMRFGGRLEYDIRCKVDKEFVMVPSFCFQPLIENAIIHGISKKEEGGKIYIDIKKRAQNIIITIADTGIGMSRDKLYQLRGAVREGSAGKIGIGLGNIYKRINRMYQEGDVLLYSTKNKGTVIKVIIPYMNQEV